MLLLLNRAFHSCKLGNLALVFMKCIHGCFFNLKKGNSSRHHNEKSFLFHLLCIFRIHHNGKFIFLCICRRKDCKHCKNIPQILFDNYRNFILELECVCNISNESQPLCGDLSCDFFWDPFPFQIFLYHGKACMGKILNTQDIFCHTF